MKVRNKGKHKKVTGQRDDAAVQQNLEDVGQRSLPNVEGSSLQVRELNTKGGKEKMGVVDHKLKSGSGLQDTLDPTQICTVVQGLEAVVKENRSWAEVGGAGEEEIGTLHRQDISAIVSKGKAKGKSLQSSK